MWVEQIITTGQVAFSNSEWTIKLTFISKKIYRYRNNILTQVPLLRPARCTLKSNSIEVFAWNPFNVSARSIVGRNITRKWPGLSFRTKQPIAGKRTHHLLLLSPCFRNRNSATYLSQEARKQAFEDSSVSLSQSLLLGRKIIFFSEDIFSFNNW